MNRLLKIGLSLAAFLCANAAWCAVPAPGAVSDTIGDYSHALQLTYGGTQGVVRFQLPQSVYLHAQSARLDDLRIFDASGLRLGFALREATAQMQAAKAALPVKVFPIMDDETRTGGLDAIELDVRTGEGGRMLSVQARPGKAARDSGAATSRRLAGLVLDLRQGDDAPLIDSLRFALPAGVQDYRAQVWIEVSDDLKQWDGLGTYELSWMVNSATQTLSNDSAQFDARHLRYARISWRSGQPIAFASVGAIVPVTTDKVAPTEQLLLTPLPGQAAGDLVYQGAVAIPVRKMGLQFGEQNVVLPAQVGSYREILSRQIGKPSTWQFEPLFGATFYQITQAGAKRSSGDLVVPPVQAAQWVLRPQGDSSARPSLRLSWSPSTLIFLANGNGPYTLAFGRKGAPSMQRELAQVAPGFSAAELNSLETATAGALRTMAPAAAGEDAAARQAAQLRLWGLWGVLLLGVGVLAVLAWRLMQQMRNAPPSK